MDKLDFRCDRLVVRIEGHKVTNCVVLALMEESSSSDRMYLYVLVLFNVRGARGTIR